ncbi:MAG: TolC family protein [Elusimicrobiaceae bacterium]|nr:TolC family protein [Elusimicrobiaceae bacterium]
MNKRYFLLLVLLFMAAPLFAQKEYGLKFSSLINDDLSLENAIRLGLENNSDFLMARQEITIAEKKVNEAKFQFLPQLALQGSATWYSLDYPMVLPDAVGNRFLPGHTLDGKRDQFFGVGVAATQYLYSGGRIRNTLKIARANLKQTQSRYEIVKNAAVLDIKKSFYNLLFAQHYDSFMQDLMQKINSWNKPASTDVWSQIQREGLLAQLQARRNQAAHDLAQAKLAMLVSLNKEFNASISITGDFSPVNIAWDLPQLNLRAMEFRPELKSAIYALELNNISIELALSKRYPDIILNASYEQLGADNLEDTNKQVSLAVRLPLPYNFSSQIAQKKAEQKKSSLQRANIEDKIRMQVTRQFEELHFWQEEVLQRQEIYQRLTDLLQKAEKNHTKQSLPALEALQVYAQAGYDYFDAIRQNKIAKAELEWAVGQDL